MEILVTEPSEVNQPKKLKICHTLIKLDQKSGKSRENEKQNSSELTKSASGKSLR